MRQPMPSPQFGLSHEQPPPGVFAQDLFKPSIRLKEDITGPKPGISLDEDSQVPALGTPSGNDDLVRTSEVNPGASAGPIDPNMEHEGEIAIVVKPPDPEVDW
jgi:hypothetical protein